MATLERAGLSAERRVIRAAREGREELCPDRSVTALEGMR
jgi:hypothetical protein